MAYFCTVIEKMRIFADAALGILMAPEKGEDTRVKITDAVEDFLKKHNIKLSRKEVVDLVDDIEDATEEE